MSTSQKLEEFMNQPTLYDTALRSMFTGVLFRHTGMSLERASEEATKIMATYPDLRIAPETNPALLAAAKQVVMDCADQESGAVISATTATILNEAIELAGGWTEEEMERLESLALGEVKEIQ